MRHFLKYDLIPLLSMAAVCAFPCVFLYARNASEVPASSMVPFLVVFSVNALAFFLGTLIFFRNASRAAFWSDVAMLVVINFCLLSMHLKQVLPFLRDRYALAFFLGTLIFFRNASRAAFWSDAAMLVVINFCLLSMHLKQVLPFLRDRYVLAVLGLMLLGLFVLLLRKKPDLRTGCLLVLIGFGVMTLVNLGLAIPAIRNSHEVRQQIPNQEFREDPFSLEHVTFSGAERPNVYYFLFDEYGGYDNLMHYYDYDNGPFLQSLQDRGFTVTYHCHNTEACYTDTLVPNLLNLNYVVKVEESGHKKAVFRNNCQLYRMFAANGYQVNLINHVDYLGPSGCRVLTSHQTRRTISEFLMRNSLYQKSAFLRHLLDQFFVSDYGANYRASLDNAMEVGLRCWQETEDGPTLTIGYYQFPHSPTMVGRHGEALPFETGWNWRDHSLYLGQMDYCNDFINDLLDEILSHDPGALIFLESDHGNRYAIHMVDLGEWDSYDPHQENPYMQNVLNCVYYRGQTFDIEDTTGINTLRRVINQVFGTDLPEIQPVVDFTYNVQDEQK